MHHSKAFSLYPTTVQVNRTISLDLMFVYNVAILALPMALIAVQGAMNLTM